MSTELSTCHRIFADLEAQRAETLAELTAWPPPRLSSRPTPTAWCAIEVLDHITKAEAGTIADVRLGLQNPHTLGTDARPGVATLDRLLRSDQTFKVPPGANIHPDTGTTFPQVTDRWQRARADLGHLLQHLTPAQANCGVFNHPFAGWMTFAEVLDHFSAHIAHHNFQLARIRTSSQ